MTTFLKALLEYRRGSVTAETPIGALLQQQYAAIAPALGEYCRATRHAKAYVREICVQDPGFEDTLLVLSQSGGGDAAVLQAMLAPARMLPRYVQLVGLL